MTIAEVAKKYNMTAEGLRYYERVGLIPPVERTKGGIRNYSDIDCEWIAFVRCMRNTGMPVEVLIEYVALCQQGDETSEAQKGLLIEQRNLLRERIAAQQRTLDLLNDKIENYDIYLKSAVDELTSTNPWDALITCRESES